MGKGDKKTRRGKIWMGTYGVRRPRKKSKNKITPVEASEIKKAKKVTEEIIEPIIVAEEKPKKTKKETTTEKEPTVKAEKATKKTTSKKTETAEQKDKTISKKTSTKKTKEK